MSALTVRQIMSLPPRPSPYCVDRNLYLKVREGRKGRINRAWLFRYYDGAKPRWRGLGPLHLVPLAEARDTSIDLLRQLRREGRDSLAPARAKRQQHQNGEGAGATFRACAEGYIQAHAPGWRSAKHRDQWETSLRQYLLPQLGDRPVGEITTQDVLAVIEPIWSTKTTTASRVCNRLEAVLDWAGARGLRSGDNNPARWKGHLAQLLPARTKVAPVQHMAALAIDQAPALATALRDRRGSPARALELILLTAVRVEEACGARWEEVDLKSRIWTIPGSRTKSGRAHRVALSGAAVDLLQALPRTADGFLFPGRKDGQTVTQGAVRIVLKALSPDAQATVHGLRSTFRDWCGERTEFAPELAELALGHAVGDQVERAYRRGDALRRRFALAEAWAAHLRGEAGT